MENKEEYERLNITLPRNLLQKFRKYCKENSINMSGKIAKMIKDYLNSEQKD